MRLLDISLAGLGLLVIAPLLLVVAILVAVMSGRPVIYRSQRMGQRGRVFSLLKFRTMRQDADSVGPGITGRNDSRVTPIGRILRRTKVDELPQLINVLKGDMSLVGPRPEDPRYLDCYSAADRRLLEMRPGLTSPASIAFRNEEALLDGPDFEMRYMKTVLPAKLSMDLSYMQSRTLWSDVKVIAETALVLLGRDVHPRAKLPPHRAFFLSPGKKS